MTRRAIRQRAPRGRSLVGERFDVTTGSVAHGGHMVARLEDEAGEVAGTVVFVRHALPGERVLVQITEGTEGERFLRADAVLVQEASPDRAVPPCPYAGPGLCGGCDFQHVDLAAQRLLKTSVVREQLRRLAHLESEVEVEPVPGDDAGLRWRTRMRFHRRYDGSLGLRAHRSGKVIPVEDCRVQAPDAVVTVEGEPAAVPVVEEQVSGHGFTMAADGFWQVHRGAPTRLVEIVLTMAQVQPGDRVLDLFAGVGLFTVFLAEAAGPGGDVDAVEGDREAVAYGEQNLVAYSWARMHVGNVARVFIQAGRLADAYDVVVLDPPREGAKRAVVDGVVARGPRTVVLVGCDPAAFARDLALFAESGYEPAEVRALDMFPMTHHVECVALLRRVAAMRSSDVS